MNNADNIKAKMAEIYDTIRDEIIYSLGCYDFAKYMYDYYDGKEPIYPSEISRLLDEYLEYAEVSESVRKEYSLED